jgi:hypothetical protein
MTTNRQHTDTALESALARYAGRVSAAGLQAEIMADVAVTDQARRSAFALPGWLARPAAPGRLAAVPTVAWVLLLVGLVLGLIAGGLAGGLWLRPDRAVVVVASPTPVREMTVVEEATDILATTIARSLPSQATCLPGSDPDALGEADQARPAGYALVTEAGAMAFDRHAGRIVLVAGVDEPGHGWQTWTYDVCDNSWQRTSPANEPPATGRLVYDADSDRIVLFTDADDREIWTYDLVADRWTRVGRVPLGVFPTGADTTSNPTYGTTFYHDPSGLVVLYDGTMMWAYDVDSNTLAKVRQRPDASRPADSGLPEGKMAIGYDPAEDVVVAVVVPYAGESSDTDPSLPSRYLVPQRQWGETWTFDPGTGSWHNELLPAASDLIVCGVMWRGSTECYPTQGRAVFDAASGMAVFITRDYGRPAAPGRVDAYDAGQRVWRTLSPATGTGGDGARWCTSMPPVYDPLNGRIVCLGPDNPGGFAGVSTFSSAANEWRWLLEP